MRLQIIVSIVLRLFCIQWMIAGVSYLFPLFSVWNNGYDTRAAFALYFGPVFFIVSSLVFWLLTPFIAQLVTRRDASVVNISGLTRHDLYCFAFVLLGLNFVLSNLSALLVRLYQFTVVITQTHQDDPTRARSFYELARFATSIVAGGAALLYASSFSSKLIRLEQKREKADAASGTNVTVTDAPLP